MGLDGEYCVLELEHLELIVSLELEHLRNRRVISPYKFDFLFHAPSFIQLNAYHQQDEFHT